MWIYDWLTGEQHEAVPPEAKCWRCQQRRIHDGCNAELCDGCCAELRRIEPLLADIDKPAA